MKKFLLIFTAFIGFACTAQQLENALLWKITGKDIKQPSYLFGTMHITCDATLDAQVLKALDDTKQLYLEIKMDDPGLQAKMMQGMMMKNGERMSKLASAKDYKLVSDFLNENLGMPGSLLDTFKPGLVSMLIMPKTMECPAESIELNLMGVANEQGEQIFGLESIEHQLAMFDAIPYKEQMDELVKMAKEGLDEQKKQNAELMRIYATKNLKAIAEYVEKEDENQHSDIMLDDRNNNWIPKIIEAAKEKPTFFGVGAAHLSGEQGVIMLLRKKGYKVEAVK